MEAIKSKSKQRVVRVFFSSPFGGLEEEREELTKKYWPQLAHLCLKAGYEFVPVDMRWGITSELSSQAATIAICLRELDRSDMIVGFFGQRYGWHGDKDEFLQRTFDFALPRYPWIDKYRDRAVTELEFLHGHLNNPGARPACFFFRDKKYDDKRLAEAEASGDGGVARKFKATTDGPNAAQFLDDLKRRVKETQNKCLDINMSYPTPAVGAKLMFDTVYKHIKETILASVTEVKELTQYEQQQGQHEAFLVSRLGMGGEYIGGQDYLKTIDSHVLNKTAGTFTGKPLLVCGESGSGKSCLLSNWLLQYKEHHPSDIVAYHFIGCATGTTDEKGILQHLCLILENECPSVTYDLPEKDAKKTSKAEGLEDVRELKRYLDELLMKTNKMDTQVVMVIDGLDKMESKNKTAQALFWFPKQFSSNICVIMSTTSSDKPNIDELTERGFKQMSLSRLTPKHRTTIAESMLMVRGKELSPEQKEKVVGHNESGNPLFLMILLKELCSFGDFFKLNDYLDSLLHSKSTIELFGKVLERLEQDYNPKDRGTNVVEEIMCCLLEAKQGLTELELKTILHISDQVWSTLYFAIDDFMVESAGVYRLAFAELAEAVRLRYYQADKTKKRHYQDLLITYFYGIFQQLSSHYKTRISPRVLNELPWLLEKVGDKKKLISCLTSLPFFNALWNSQKYELIGYWNATDEAGEYIMKRYLSAIDEQITIIYNDAMDKDVRPWPNTSQELLDTAKDLTEFLEDAGHFMIREPMILRTIKMHDATYIEDRLLKDADVAELYCELHNTLACQYASMERFEDAEKIHKELLSIKDKFGNRLENNDSLKAVTLNNLGYIQTKMGKHEEAVEYYQQCLDLHKSVHGNMHVLVADTMNNLAQTYFQQGQCNEAISMFEDAIEIYEEVYFGVLPPDVGGTVLNLAMCKIRTPGLDIKTVEPLYQKALDIRVNAVGRDHPAVSQTLTSFGSFLMRLEEYDRSMKMFTEALAISEAANGLENQETLKILENIALVYLIEKKLEEAHPYYKKAGDILHEQGRMDMSLPSLNKCMVDYYLNSGRHADAIDALMRIVGTHFATDRDYAALDFLIGELPADQRPKIPEEHTVVAAIKQFPNSVMLLGRVMVALCQTGDGEAMRDVLIAGSFDGSQYNQSYAQFMQNGQGESAQHIIIAAAEKFPQDGIILENAAKCHAMHQRYPEAIVLIKKAIDVNPDDLGVLELGGRLMAMGGELQDAQEITKKALEKATEQDQEELVTKLKNNLQLIENSIAEQNNS
ncbi:TPR repeat-containing protein DDB_G0287407-like [Amphiura filiformis]|uniref:TPR repeat-containing protein DDB_G0287407-like n=1 Tax=Amphiura filiformis TaxID=82378 RepID=UPI003B225586